jgi:hypothetical protein
VRVPPAAPQPGHRQGHLDAAVRLLAGGLAASWELARAAGRRLLTGPAAGRAAPHQLPATKRSPAAPPPAAAQQIKSDFTNYDESAAWPYLLDEFVEYMKEKK